MTKKDGDREKNGKANGNIHMLRASLECQNVAKGIRYQAVKFEFELSFETMYKRANRKRSLPAIYAEILYSAKGK